MPHHRFYVYVLARPDARPFYVGKGQGPRIFVHDQEALSGHRCHKCNVIRKIWKQGGEYQRYIVFTTDDEQEAFDYEKELIALYGRENLCNLTDGGEGCSGRVVSEETRKKLSERHKGRKGTRLGMTNSPEHRRKVSEALKGRKLGEDRIKRMSAAMKGKPSKISADARTRLSERMRGNTHGVGKAARKGQVRTADERRKISETLKAKAPWRGKRHTPESIQKMREAQRQVRDNKSKTFECQSPDGVIYTTHNLKKFCAEQGLTYTSMQRAMYQGKTHKKWRVRKVSD